MDAELGGEIAPFATVLLQSESAASSQIENLTATARAIAEAELPGGKARRNAEMIVANTAAMKAAVALSDAVDADAILAMHRALMINDPRHTHGAFRTEPVWIGGGSTPIGATFVGPRHELIPGAIADLIAFAQRADVPALPQIAVGHAQFETIHPFTDGNGRTGRALVQSLLRNKGLTRQVTVPVSAGLLADTDAYFAALTSYRDGDAAPIVERFSRATVAGDRQRATTGRRTSRDPGALERRDHRAVRLRGVEGRRFVDPPPSRERRTTGAGAGHRVHQRSPLPQPAHRGGNPRRDN